MAKTKNKESVIEQWLDIEGKENNHYEELFNPTDERIDLKTELDQKQIGLINRIKHNIRYLKKLGLKADYYENMLISYMRLMVSNERKSRGEYVEVNKKPAQELTQATSEGMRR